MSGTYGIPVNITETIKSPITLLVIEQNYGWRVTGYFEHKIIFLPRSSGWTKQLVAEFVAAYRLLN